ncbi:MAG TPA: glycosyltransferase family 4 protein [Alphaproteobacteria bacterium]|nr:glycosyltransferase family 4 protein [Alphaproteobacteria bacterium]
MRLGLVIYGSLDTLTGGYLYDRMVVEHLRRHGDEVEVISLPWRTYIQHLADNVAGALWRRLAQARFDILLQDELNHPSLVWLNRRLRRAGRCPIVAIVHLLRCSEPRAAWQSRLYRWVERHYLQSVDGCIYNSQTTRTAVEGVVGADQPGVVAYPGGDHLESSMTPEQIVARARQPGPLHILFLGNLSPVKGLHTLLQAVNRLPPDAWRLTVIGSLTMAPGYVRRIRRQIARAGMEDQVALLGALPPAEVAAHLARCHVLAGPSLYEAFGIAYLEAMCFGMPVVASTAGAAHELITPAQTGFLIAPGDAEALTQHLQTWQCQRELLLQMGLAARQRAMTHPTWAESVGRMRAFLLSLRG